MSLSKAPDEGKLIGRIAAAGAFIEFEPFEHEPDPGRFLSANALVKPTVVIPRDRDADSHALAAELTAKFGGISVAVFVPGIEFDLFGTRHGRGGGWYDRFLSMVPPEWVRIGVADVTRVRDFALERNSWDEPVDYLLIRDGETWKTWKTDARPHA